MEVKQKVEVEVFDDEGREILPSDVLVFNYGGKDTVAKFVGEEQGYIKLENVFGDKENYKVRPSSITNVKNIRKIDSRISAFFRLKLEDYKDKYFPKDEEPADDSI